MKVQGESITMFGRTAEPGEAVGLFKARRAIVVVDMVESVRLMAAHEDDVIVRWQRFVQDVREQVLVACEGRMVKSLGDGLLLEFPHAPPAARAALEMQRLGHALNGGYAPDACIALRMGVHVADVVVADFDVLGAGVNLAARLAALAGPGEIVVSADAADELVADLDGELTDLGECYLRHIDRPQRCFRLSPVSDGRSSVAAVDVLPVALAMHGPMIAILPFDDTGEGLPPGTGAVVAEELSGCLSRSQRLQVVSSLTMRALAARPLSPEAIGQLCGARFVVSGRAIARGRRLYLSMALADTRHGTVQWSERFETSMAALLRPDGAAVLDIAQQIQGAVDRVEIQRLGSRPLPTLESYTLLVGGVALMHRTAPSDFARAHDILHHLVDRHGRHPMPQAWLAQWHVLRVQQGWSDDPQADARQALALTRRALDADPGCALASTVEGFARANVLREFDEAGLCYARALDHNPNDSLAWLLTGMLHAFKDEGEAAVRACTQARRLSPLDPLRYFYDSLAASAALTAERYDSAIALARASLKANCSHMSTHRALTAALGLAGRLDDARLASQELLARDPGFTVSGFLARTPGQAYAASARVAEGLRRAGLPA